MAEDERRGALKKLYATAHWQRLREHQLATHPLCASCLRAGRVVPATVAHHVDGHDASSEASLVNGFFLRPLESVCTTCHDAAYQREEIRGYSSEVDPATGLPIDPRHPFNLAGERDESRRSRRG